MQTASALLSRRPHAPQPEVTLGEAEIALRLGRVHELCGRARRSLALAVAACLEGPVVWITAYGAPDSLCADGVADWINPGRILFVQTKKRNALLWAMEEALRDGRAPLVVGDMSAPPAIVPIRRLHLAAEAGCGAGLCHPLALLLTPENGGAPGIETRWSLTPAHRSGAHLWRLDRLRARMAPPRHWHMTSGPNGLVPCSKPDRQHDVAQGEPCSA